MVSDITTGGNAFLSGGYVRAISASQQPDRRAPGLDQGYRVATAAAPTYITSSINLPASAAGHNVAEVARGDGHQRRRLGRTSARIDDVKVSLNTPGLQRAAQPTLPTAMPTSP